MGFPGGSDHKESACNVGDPGSILGSGRSAGEGNGNPLQYSCLENPMDRRGWQATVFLWVLTQSLVVSLLGFSVSSWISFSSYLSKSLPVSLWSHNLLTYSCSQYSLIVHFFYSINNNVSPFIHDVSHLSHLYFFFFFSWFVTCF